ncbi:MULTISPECIES: TNT domain-containing protein [Bacillaceae]|uniref:TNT domain-containing protein n=1 Tax=Bacillaceae TaxID=186817 RepID=UPI002FFF369C
MTTNRELLGESKTVTLKPGTIIDRFGYEGGTFVSLYGVPYEARALAPETYLKPYSIYVVTRPVEVEAGTIAPWFDEVGLGIQFNKTPVTTYKRDTVTTKLTNLCYLKIY